MKNYAWGFSLAAFVFSCLTGSNQVRAEQGWTAVIDQLFLAPKLSASGVQRIFYYGELPSSTEQYGTIDSPLQYATRLTIANEGNQGGGAQIRWFAFDQDQQYQGEVNEGPGVTLLGGLNLDVDALDFELTQRGSLGVWDWLATAGARYADLSLREQDINFEDLLDTVWFGSTGVAFRGAGPTFSLLGQRALGNSGISVFGRGRTALLFGDTDLFSAFRTGGVYTNPDDFVQVWEFQLGANAERRMEVIDVFGGIFWEAQRWDSDSDFLGDLAFHGLGVSTGIRY